IDDDEARASVENVHSIPGRVERPLNAVVNCEHSISDGFLFTLAFPALSDTLSSQSMIEPSSVGRVFRLDGELSRFCPSFTTGRTFSIQTVGKRMVLS
ncbi:hypothetical protein K0M31_004526, partial [Melipona bicolor]